MKKILLIISCFSIVFSYCPISLASESNNEWSQNDFSGGQSSQVVNIVPGGPSNNKYTSSENITITGLSTIRLIDTSKNGELVSSIYYAGEYALTPFGTDQFRFGSSPNNLSDWKIMPTDLTGTNPNELKYIQLKNIIKPDPSMEPTDHFGKYFSLLFMSRMFSGQISDEGGTPIDKAEINLNGVKTYSAISITPNAPKKSYWSVAISPWKTKDTTFTFTVTKQGYNTLTRQITESDLSNISPNAMSFVLKKSGTSGGTSNPFKPTLSLSSTSRIGTNGEPVTLGVTDIVSIFPTQKLTYSGTTSASAKVTFTIKSDPIIKEVTADANGAWTYTLDPKELALETGTHTVSAIATDTAGVVSDSVALASFELLPPLDTTPPEPYKFKARDLLTPINYALGGLAILLIAGLIFLFIRRRKAKLNINN